MIWWFDTTSSKVALSYLARYARAFLSEKDDLMTAKT